MVVVIKGEDLPPGFRFTPTDEELVGFFLLNKVIMQPFQFDCYIEEKNIYADAPWNVFTDNQDWSKLNVDDSAKKTQFYAFTKLKKNGKNVVRSAGCGKWHGQTGPKPVKNEYGNEIIGWKKMLTFELLKKNGEGASKLEGHWIMHEYSLDKDFLKKWLENNVVFSDHEEIVICHITRDHDKCLRGSNKLLVDDHAIKERIALNIQENPRPPLMIEREANAS